MSAPKVTIDKIGTLKIARGCLMKPLVIQGFSHFCRVETQVMKWQTPNVPGMTEKGKTISSENFPNEAIASNKKASATAQALRKMTTF